MNNLSGKNEEAEWEVRPGGMLVQRREENGHDHQNHHHRHHHHEAAASGSTIKINVSHGPAQHEVSLPANSTFGNSSILLEVVEFILFETRNTSCYCTCLLLIPHEA